MSLWADTLEFLGLRAPDETRANHTFKEVEFWLRDDVWGSTQTDAGVFVSEASAVTVPDVYACVNVIAQDVARCPLKLQQRSPDGDWVDAERSSLWDLLQWLPNPETTAVEFWASLVRDVQIFGKAYAEIIRNGIGMPMQLWRLDPSRMTITRDALGRKVYVYRSPDTNTEKSWTFDASRPPFFELSAWSWIGQCKNLIGLASALDTYGSKYFANAARPSGVLVAPKTLSDQARERLAKSWRATYGGADNSHKVAVLEEGLEFKPLSVPNNEAQFIEMRRFVSERICGAAGVPPHKIAELSRSTNNNIEQQSRDYLERLSPYFAAIEQACRRDLLSDTTWPRYRAVFDKETLVQTDIVSLSQAFGTFRQNGIFSANDIRRKLHENPIPADQGGDNYVMNGTMIPLAGAPDSTDTQAADEAIAQARTAREGVR